MTHNVTDVKTYIGHITTPHEMMAAIMTQTGAWHPDDPAAEIIDGRTGQRLFTNAAAGLVDLILDSAFALDADRVYDIALKNAATSAEAQLIE